MDATQTQYTADDVIAAHYASMDPEETQPDPLTDDDRRQLARGREILQTARLIYSHRYSRSVGPGRHTYQELGSTDSPAVEISAGWKATSEQARLIALRAK